MSGWQQERLDNVLRLLNGTVRITVGPDFPIKDFDGWGHGQYRGNQVIVDPGLGSGFSVQVSAQ